MGKVPVNERELRIFEENLLPGLFRPQLMGKHKIVYTAPMSIPLGEYMKKDLTVHKIYNILAQVVEMTKKVEIYGFYLYNLVLDEQLIYVKEMTGELYFLYEPLADRDNSTNVYAFLSDLTGKIKSKERAVAEECARIRDFFADPGNYRIEDIERFIMGAYPQIYQQVIRAESGMSGFITSSRLSYREHYEKKGGTVLLQEEEEGTVLLQEEEEGTVLLEEPKAARLYRKRTGEIIDIRGYEFHIGKDTKLDYCIGDNKAISRRHAAIYCMGAEYSIQDEHSTNHTYVNGKLLEAGSMEPLENGDIVRLADEEFEVMIE